MASKRDLVGMLVEAEGLSQAKAQRVVNALFEGIVKLVDDGSLLQVRGFGTFRKRHIAARDGKNPRNGEVMRFPGRDVIKFRATR
jgi:DNA-binding protein HU-beta